MFISVAICTHNRYQALQEALGGLLRQKLNLLFSCQVLVIDNNSNDRTRQVIEKAIPLFKGRLRYIFEKKQGLSFARNKAVTEAQGEVIAFTDDDCVPDINWLQVIYRRFSSDPHLSLLTGRDIVPFAPQHSPCADLLAPHTAVYHKPHNPWSVGNGSNFAVRRSVFRTVGLFDEALGAGTNIGAAEDNDLFYRVLKEGLKIIFDPNLIVYSQLKTPAQAKKAAYNYAKGRGAFYMKHILKNDLSIWPIILSNVLRTAKPTSGVISYHYPSQLSGLITGAKLYLLTKK